MTMFQLLMIGALCVTTATASQDIHFQAEMVLAGTDITSMDQGEQLWQQDYQVTPGEEIKLTYLTQNDEAHSFVLSLHLPKTANWGEQEVSLHGFWERPDENGELVTLGHHQVVIEGDFFLTLLVDEQTKQGIHLHLTPRINWGERPEQVDLPQLNLSGAYVVVNGQVVARELNLQSTRFALRDGNRKLCTLSTIPLATDLNGQQTHTQGNLFRSQNENAILEIINAAPLDHQTLWIAWEPDLNLPQQPTTNLTLVAELVE